MTQPQQMDPEAFASFEHDGWEAAAATYADAFDRFTTQAIEPLLDAVEAGPGVRLLDVACGPGWLSAAATQRGANGVRTDDVATVCPQPWPAESDAGRLQSRRPG